MTHKPHLHCLLITTYDCAQTMPALAAAGLIIHQTASMPCEKLIPVLDKDVFVLQTKEMDVAQKFLAYMKKIYKKKELPAIFIVTQDTDKEFITHCLHHGADEVVDTAKDNFDFLELTLRTMAVLRRCGINITQTPAAGLQAG